MGPLGEYSPLLCPGEGKVARWTWSWGTGVRGGQHPEMLRSHGKIVTQHHTVLGLSKINRGREGSCTEIQQAASFLEYKSVQAIPRLACTNFVTKATYTMHSPEGDRLGTHLWP